MEVPRGGGWGSKRKSFFSRHLQILVSTKPGVFGNVKRDGSLNVQIVRVRHGLLGEDLSLAFFSPLLF